MNIMFPTISHDGAQPAYQDIGLLASLRQSKVNFVWSSVVLARIEKTLVTLVSAIIFYA